jgi:hypothetical protein
MKTERIPLTELTDRLPEEIDLLIVSASFEMRCRSVADVLDPEKVGRTLVAQNQNHAEFHDDQANYLISRFGRRSSLMPLDTSEPLQTADNMERCINEAMKENPRNIVVDISTFTREGFLILFRILSAVPRHKCPKYYVYARAQEYSIGSQPEDKWLSRGIASVRSVLGYPGSFEPSRRLHMIVLVGFEYDRVAELIRRCEPSEVSLGQSITSEPDSQNHLDAHRRSYDRLRSVFGEVHKFEFPSYDSDGARAAVLAQHRAHMGYNCMVAPMNTKVSAMGSAEAALEDQSIQVVYAQAVLYNVQSYSRPGDVCYLMTNQS